jgi:phycocyanobilin lyase subunit alpha
LGKNRIKESIPALLEALQDREDRTELGGYPLRRNAARALGKLGSEEIFGAIPALIEALNCEDFYVREAAAQSIEEIATSSETNWNLAQVAIAPLMELLQVTDALTNLVQPYEAILEALGRLKADSAKALVESFLKHSVPRIRFAAARAMYGITQEAEYGAILIEGLNSPDINLRRTVLTDLGEIGYLPAGSAIARCQAENSFKLFALKRILDANLGNNSSDSLSQELKQVMVYMDELL